MPITPEQRAERRQLYEKARSAQSRGLHQIGRVSYFVDPSGRVWGIRIFNMNELTMFDMNVEAIKPFILDETINGKSAWITFFQFCLVNAELKPGIITSLRRVLGLPDYSRRQVWRSGFLSLDARSRLLDAIMLANYEKDFVGCMTPAVQRIDKRTGKPVVRKSISIGETMASFVYHYQIPPEQFMNMTMPQLNAYVSYANEQSRENKRNNNAGEVM